MSTFLNGNSDIAYHSPLNILLLEDYQLDAEMVKLELKRGFPNFTINHVCNKRDFEEALETNCPDVIISDFSLPQYNALEAYTKVKEMGIQVPFILITGELDEESAIDCIKSGIDDYVIKRSLVRLGMVINKALEKKRYQNQQQKFRAEIEASEERYANIFNNAGVGICVFKLSRENQKLKIQPKQPQLLYQLEMIECNVEAINLFEAQSKDELVQNFHKTLDDESLPFMKAISEIHEGTPEQITVESEFVSFRENNLQLKVKMHVSWDEDPCLTISFIDLSAIKRSEDRLYKVMNQLENTVELRTREMTKLNERLQKEAKSRQLVSDQLRNNYIEMTESIIAAKSIQQLMLPSTSAIASAFEDSFVYLRPKDIVSGDFYWFYKKGNKCWVAAVDCTGHGVPGAFMSMISSKILNQIVIEQNLEKPSEIMQELDNYVVRELKQHEMDTHVSTGMDMSICFFDFDKGEMRHSGALQTTYFIRNGIIKALRGDRFSIGGTFQLKNKNFTEQVEKIEKGDRVFMHTDGFVDQFGGTKNKKFTRKRFYDLLRGIQKERLIDQESMIKNSLQNWKGMEPQVDDILVIGLEV